MTAHLGNAPARFDWSEQPNPPGGRGVTRIVFFLLLADLATLGGLAGQIAWMSALRDPVDATLIGDPAANTAGGFGMILGAMVALAYALWPIGSLRDRAPDELRAFRMLCWALLIGHPLLLATLALGYASHGRDAIGFVFLAAPIAVLLTPALWPVGRALAGATWMKLSAPPGVWDAPMTRPSLGEPTPAWIAWLLPFVAAFRAGRNGLAVMALLLWSGGLVMLFVAPWRAIVPLALASGIGWRAQPGAHAASEAPPLRPRPVTSRHAVDRGPLAVAAMLFAPIVLTLDALAAIVLLALARARSVEAFLQSVQGSTIVLFVALPFALGAVALCNGTGGTGIARRAIAALLTVAHLGMAALCIAISFRVSLMGRQILIGDPGYALLAPLTWTLIATLPLPGLLAASAVAVRDR